jgi:hypothetical protein
MQAAMQQSSRQPALSEKAGAMNERQTRGMHPGKVQHLPTMSKSAEIGQLITITCTWCRISHRYEPCDLLQLLGDVPFLNIEINFRCSECGKQEYLKAALDMPSANARVGMKVRRLVEIRTIRKPIWKDVTL